MNGEKSMLLSFQSNKDPYESIVFSDDGKREVMGLGKIAISNDN